MNNTLEVMIPKGDPNSQKSKNEDQYKGDFLRMYRKSTTIEKEDDH